MRIRDYTNLLPLRDVHIPYLKNLPEKRLRNKDFSHATELKALKYLQQRFATQGTLFRKLGWIALPYIRKGYKNPEIEEQAREQIAPITSSG